MKKLIALIILLSSITIFAQDNHLVEIILNGKPVMLNTKTGETQAINGNSSVDNPIAKNNTEIINTHTIEKGDTLYSISKKYGVSMAHIKSVNSLKSNILSINQVLKIGYAVSAKVNANASVWIVKSGDTLYAISKQTGVAIDVIKKLNNLNSNIISVGQQLSLK